MIIDLQRYWGERQIYYAGELSAKIIESMRQDNSVILRTKESKNAQLSGLFDLLDQLCDFYAWDKSKITLETGNLFTSHTQYAIKYIHATEYLAKCDTSKICHTEWNQQNFYGMFIGRANTTRLRAAIKHNMFEFKNFGLTSFNHDVDYEIDDNVLLDYLCASDDRFSQVMSLKAYSDIGPVIKPPITCQFIDETWNKVYQRIAIEIVCETPENEGCWGPTEKILRPISYRRPFLLIAAPHTIELYKNLPQIVLDKNFVLPDGTSMTAEMVPQFRFFEPHISTEYDKDFGIHRVDHVFDILHELIRTKRIYSILQDCAQDIEHNYNELSRVTQLYQSKFSNSYDSYWQTNTWSRPNYK